MQGVGAAESRLLPPSEPDSHTGLCRFATRRWAVIVSNRGSASIAVMPRSCTEYRPQDINLSLNTLYMLGTASFSVSVRHVVSIVTWSETLMLSLPESMGAPAVAVLPTVWRANLEAGCCVMAGRSSLAVCSLPAIAVPGDDSASSMRHAGAKLGRLCSFVRLGRLGRFMMCSSSCNFHHMPQVNEDAVFLKVSRHCLAF